MDKLKRYNQKLLAIIGTLIVVIILILLITGLVALIYDIVKDDPSTYNDNTSITIDENGHDANRFRDQGISFEEPYLIDTLNNIYLIPVSQINLKLYEMLSSNRKEMVYLPSESYRYYRKIEGTYNNMILFNKEKEIKSPLFSELTFIASYQKIMLDSNLYILFETVTEDSNGDKKLNNQDHKKLSVYSLKSKLLKHYGFKDMSYEGFYPLFNSSELLLSFILDNDKNGYTDYQEPSCFKRLDVVSGKTEDLIEEKMKQELQQLID